MSSLILAALLWSAADPAAFPEPEECFAASRDRVVESAAFAGKTYEFKREGCRALFESDPERYSQLFDALAELDAQGVAVEPEPESLVPS